MQIQDRRASGVKRVPVQTLVEICGRVRDVPAFEAQSVEVSGRGMQVRTRYLPPEGAPLVLRFEDRGQQILVEGEVAWVKEEVDGGQFGIRFTALDSGSVDALRELCKIPEEIEAEAEAEELEAALEAEAPEATKSRRKAKGTQVRLHIEGLAAPMRAQVHRAGGRRMTAGAPLEFLKHGRKLHIEDTQEGDRLAASIDSVSVVLDPQSQIPQLVVSLDYAEPFEDATPEPSEVQTRQAPARSAGQIHSSRQSMSAGPAHAAPSSRSASGANAAAAGGAALGDSAAARGGDSVRSAEKKRPASEPMEFLEDDEDDFDESFDEEGVSAEFEEELGEPSALQTKLSQVASGAGAIAKNTGAALKHVGLSTATRIGGWIQSSKKKRTAAGKQTASPRSQQMRSMRRPSPASSMGGAGSESRRLRPQHGGAAAAGRERAEEQEPRLSPNLSSKKLKRYGVMAGAAVLLTGVVALAMRDPSPVPGEASAQKTESQLELSADGPSEFDEMGNPISEGEGAEVKASAAKKTGSGISADVPLFGPTPMATTEAAPVDAPEEELADEPVDDTPPVEDETWEEAEGVSVSKAAPAAAPADPSSVKPWGHGSVVRPTIHRIRLDAPGGAIQGAVNPTGFTVVIPGRKTMESGDSIAKRDSRVARVRTSSSGGGAQIAVQFKNGIPGYRVRLRKDYVEILITEPKKAGTVAAR